MASSKNKLNHQAQVDFSLLVGIEEKLGMERVNQERLKKRIAIGRHSSPSFISDAFKFQENFRKGLKKRGVLREKLTRAGYEFLVEDAKRAGKTVYLETSLSLLNLFLGDPDDFDALASKEEMLTQKNRFLQELQELEKTKELRHKETSRKQANTRKPQCTVLATIEENPCGVVGDRTDRSSNLSSLITEKVNEKNTPSSQKQHQDPMDFYLAGLDYAEAQKTTSKHKIKIK